jgi:hypothetical protein
MMYKVLNNMAPVYLRDHFKICLSQIKHILLEIENYV